MEQDATRQTDGRIDPAIVHRELSEAIERTDQLGDAIKACLHDVERELADIKHEASASKPSDQRATG